MSFAHPSEASRSARLDAYQDFATFNASIENARETVYPSLYLLPGASHSPVALPPNATPSTLPPLAQDTYGTRGVYRALNDQGHGAAYSQAGFSLPIEHPSQSVNDTNLHPTRYPFHHMSVGNVISTTVPLASAGAGHYEQPAPFNFTFQCTAPQPKAPLDQQQIQQVQDHLWSDLLDTQADPTEAYHTCSNNPFSACLGRDTICLDVLLDFVGMCPDVFSEEELSTLISLASVPHAELNARLSAAGPSSQVDTIDPRPSPNTQMGRGMASLASSTIASTSTTTLSSSSELLPHTLSYSTAGLSSRGSTSLSGVKRKRSEDHLEDGVEEQRQEGYTDAQRGDHSHRGEPSNSQNPGCKEKHCEERKKKKKKKLSEDEEFICRICLILGRECKPLSRKDALKRHILSLHELFVTLLDHELLDLLAPRRKNQSEDLMILTTLCISVQLEAQRHGKEIKSGHDLVPRYPHIAAALSHS